MPTWDWGAAAFESARVGGSFLLALVGNAVLPRGVVLSAAGLAPLMERAGCLVPLAREIASGAS